MSGTQSKVIQPTVNASTAEERRAKLRERTGRFRVLIVGRANAGKTTILKKICNTTDDPEIYNSNGERIDTSNVEPTAGRGTHDIENEMVFRSNPGFVFHDSRGFEAGGVDELQKVKAFVCEHAKEKDLRNQVHVIWYCIPMNDSRPIANAEIQFFSRSGTGKVPVIVVFTKCEALEVQAIEALQKDNNLSYGDAVKSAPEYAKKHFQTVHLELEIHKYPPQSHVYLQEMDKSNTDCKELVECTAAVLDSDILQAMFVSTQQISLELSVKYSIRQVMKQGLEKNKINSASKDKGRLWLDVLMLIMRYFPYWMNGHDLHYYDHQHHIDPDFTFKKFNANETASITSALAQLAHIYALPSTSTENVVIQVGSALAIIAEHLYFIWRHADSISADAVPSTILLYQQSPTCAVVTGQVEEAFSEYSNSIAQLESSAWRHFKDVVQKRKVKNQAKDILQEKLNNIVLGNRLDKAGL